MNSVNSEWKTVDHHGECPFVPYQCYLMAVLMQDTNDNSFTWDVNLGFRTSGPEIFIDRDYEWKGTWRRITLYKEVDLTTLPDPQDVAKEIIND